MPKKTKGRSAAVATGSTSPAPSARPAQPAAPFKTNSIEQVRYPCSIAAMHTAAAIPRVIPITHCGPGCADKQFVNLAMYNAWQGAGYGGGAVVPSTNASEREVVFGGAERLRELIAASQTVLDADLFVVVTGCISDLVGDDVGAVAREFASAETPVAYAETGGFRGNNFTGHELVAQAIIEQIVGEYDGPRRPGLVNVWSLLPYHNPFWRGDLTEIKRLLEGAGLEVNILFGPQSGGLDEWRRIPEAQFNLVLSPWLGLATARFLGKKYGQPFLHVPVLPIGAKASAEMIRQAVAFAGIDPAPAEVFIAAEERAYYHYLQDFTTFYAEYWWGLPAKFAVLADSAYALGLTKFLVNQLGLIPALQIITDNPPEEHRAAIQAEFATLADDVSAEVGFEEDSYTIHQRLRATDFGSKPPIIFGTTWERDIAKAMKSPIVEVTFPTTYEVVLSRSYVGYRGALTLLEKIYSTIVSASA